MTFLGALWRSVLVMWVVWGLVLSVALWWRNRTLSLGLKWWAFPLAAFAWPWLLWGFYFDKRRARRKYRDEH